MNGKASQGTELIEREREMLDFERTWWKHQGAKEDEIRRRFDVTATRYYQQLIALLARPEVEIYDPQLVRRLRRVYLRGRRG